MRTRIAIIAILLAVTLSAASLHASSQPPAQNGRAPAFSYSLEIAGILATEFASADGFACEMEVVAYQRGDDSSRLDLQPGVERCGPITLERELTSDAELWAWYEATREGTAEPRPGALVVLDGNGEEMARYVFSDAWPSKYAIGGVDARNDEALNETLVIQTTGIQRIT
jgi:phage tail-like protein